MKTQWCVAIVALSAILAGCGSDNKFEPNATIMPVDSAKQARTYFDKANGNYDSLTPEDKTAYLALFNNDEAKGKQIWELMANPPTSRPGAPSAPRPN